MFNTFEGLSFCFPYDAATFDYVWVSYHLGQRSKLRFDFDPRPESFWHAYLCDLFADEDMWEDKIFDSMKTSDKGISLYWEKLKIALFFTAEEKEGVFYLAAKTMFNLKNRNFAREKIHCDATDLMVWVKEDGTCRIGFDQCESIMDYKKE